MSQPVYSLGDYGRNIAAMCDAYFIFAPLRTLIDGWVTINFGPLSAEMTQAAKNEALKILTTNVVAMMSDLNCYPTGYTTAILFDIEGNPLP